MVFSKCMWLLYYKNEWVNEWVCHIYQFENIQRKIMIYLIIYFLTFCLSLSLSFSTWIETFCVRDYIGRNDCKNKEMKRNEINKKKERKQKEVTQFRCFFYFIFISVCVCVFFIPFVRNRKWEREKLVARLWMRRYIFAMGKNVEMKMFYVLLLRHKEPKA